jgi:hypothetical protein
MRGTWVNLISRFETPASRAEAKKRVLLLGVSAKVRNYDRVMTRILLEFTRRLCLQRAIPQNT